MNVIHNIWHTFRNSQETEQYEAITMRTPDIIVYAPNGKVKWPVLVMTGAYWNSGFIAP